MFTLKFENQNGEIITLSGVESMYQILNVEGLNPPSANIKRSEVAGMDGTKYMSAKLEERNIVLTLRINGNVEKNRIYLYNYFQSKQYCKMQYTNGSRSVYAEGYVENIECGLFTISEQMQISIICPDPYFYDMKEIVTDISHALGAFAFPFSFGASGVTTPTVNMIDTYLVQEYAEATVPDQSTDSATEFSTYVINRVVNLVNYGENDTGVIIEIVATDTVVNPRIRNDRMQFFELNTTLSTGDVVTINTNKGYKSVQLFDDLNTISIINKVTRGSTWLTLQKGDNQLTYNAEEGADNMRVRFIHRAKYQAV